MPVSFSNLDDLIPHRDAMVLIDEVVSCDMASATLTAKVTIKPQWQENWAAIEFMAQTAAAFAGIADRAKGLQGSPRPGFLLGTRKLEIFIDRFIVGHTYLITTCNSFFAEDVASFDCKILDGDTLVAKATLSAYRPDSSLLEVPQFFRHENVRTPVNKG